MLPGKNNPNLNVSTSNASVQSRTNTLGNHEAMAPRTSHTRYPKGLLQVLQGSSAQGSVTPMGARQAELSTCDHAFLHEPGSSVVQGHPSCPASMAEAPCTPVHCGVKGGDHFASFCSEFPSRSRKRERSRTGEGKFPFSGFLLSWLFLHSASIICFISY